MKTKKITLLIGSEHLEKDSYLYTNILLEIKGIPNLMFSMIHIRISEGEFIRTWVN